VCALGVQFNWCYKTTPSAPCAGQGFHHYYHHRLPTSLSPSPSQPTFSVEGTHRVYGGLASSAVDEFVEDAHLTVNDELQMVTSKPLTIKVEKR